MAEKVYVEGYNTLPDGRNIWLFQCNYEESEGEGYSLLDGHFDKKSFKADRMDHWGGEEWVRSSASLKRIREEFRAGDWMFLYQAKPNRALVGLARLGKHRLGAGREDGSFTTDWTYPVPHLSRGRIEADEVLKDSEFIRVKQGTIFRVSPPQAKRLLELLALDDEDAQLVFSRWDPPGDFRESFRPMKRAAMTAPRLQDAALRAAVEQHAVTLAVQHYRELGFDVEELGKPYDLRCTRAGEEVHVEVKGTTTDGRAVMLTANEVEHANAGTFRTDLVVVSNISVQLDEDGQIETSGGEMSLWEAWHPEPAALRPVQFEYQVPAQPTPVPVAPPGPVQLKRSELELVIVQTSPDLSRSEAVSILGQALADAAGRREGDEEWLGLVGEANHWSGLTRWIAVSDTVPEAVVEALQAACEERGLRADVEQANAVACSDLLPELRVSSDGIEKLVPQPIARAGAEWRDGPVTGRVRGYVWER